ncbi:MAG: hypothetical protein ACRDKW_11845, partial [Actinomycetota bacterium]
MELDQAPPVCRYDGCALGPDGGPAPLVQPVRGGNLREYCSDRHRIAAHRARHRRTAPQTTAVTPSSVEDPPSEVVARLRAIAEDLSAISGEVGRAFGLADADRVARTLEDARLRATEAEARATVAAAER